jgi:multicomponent Na+:H+ antiporter subunit B
MKTSLLFQKISSTLFFSILLLALFYFLRGHQAPGGGFIAGLLAVGAYWVLYLAYDVENMQKKLFFQPRTLMALGLLFGVLSSIIGLVKEKQFFKAQWPQTPLQFFNSFGTPVLFDFGVFLVVLGLGTFWIVTLSKDET